MARANNSPEEAVVALCTAMMGGPTGKWDLEEEESVQLWLVFLAKGPMVCVGGGAAAGSVLDGHFCGGGAARKGDVRQGEGSR
jgi:hypothetical protein